MKIPLLAVLIIMPTNEKLTVLQLQPRPTYITDQVDYSDLDQFDFVDDSDIIKVTEIETPGLVNAWETWDDYKTDGFEFGDGDQQSNQSNPEDSQENQVAGNDK